MCGQGPNTVKSTEIGKHGLKVHENFKIFGFKKYFSTEISGMCTSDFKIVWAEMEFFPEVFPSPEFLHYMYTLYYPFLFYNNK